MHRAEYQFISFGVTHLRNLWSSRAINDVDKPHGRDRRGCSAQERSLGEAVDNRRVIDITTNQVSKLWFLLVSALCNIAQQLQHLLGCFEVVWQHGPADEHLRSDPNNTRGDAVPLLEGARCQPFADQNWIAPAHEVARPE